MSQLILANRRGSDSHKWSLYAEQDVIPAWVADTDYQAAEPIIDALRERVQHGVFGYAIGDADDDGDGKGALAQTIRTYFARRWQWEVAPQWFVYSPGLGCAIHNVCRMAAGGSILTPSPIYHVFRTAPTIAGATRIDVPMRYSDADGWQWRVEDLEAARQPDTRVLQLCNPHNPNGKVFTRNELEAIGEFCCRHDLTICADEVHADIILDAGRPHIPIASISDDIAKRTITLQSPSKAFNIAGLNFAVVVTSDAALRQQYQTHAQGKVISHLNPFAYTAAAAAWSGACDGWLDEMNAQLRTNRDALSAAVAKVRGVTMPHLAATYLAWLNISELNLSDPPKYFEQHGVGMSAGATFGDANYMRLNFGCSPDLLQKIITRLHTAATRTIS